MNIKDLLASAATAGDVGAVTGGYGLLALVDAFGWFGGIPTIDVLTSGAVGAALGLSVKKLGEALLRAGRTKRRLKKFSTFVLELQDIDPDVQVDILRRTGRVLSDSSLSDEQLVAQLEKLQQSVHQ